MAGRPLTYKTKEELQEAIDQYFKECEGKPITDEDGEIILVKGQPVTIGKQPPTVSGLAYALGFNSRQSLLNYQGRKAFMDTITRAKLYIEAYVEGRLFDKDGVNGAKFSLINNFKKWSEKSENDDQGKNDIQNFLDATNPATEFVKQVFEVNHEKE